MTDTRRRIEEIIRSLPETHGHALSETGEEFVRSYAEAPEPDAALNRLERLLDAATSLPDVLELFESERSRRILSAITWNSGFLSHLVARHPDWLLWLCREAPLEAAMRLKSFQQAVEEIEAEAEDAADRLRALRRFRYRQSLRIGVREICNLGGVDSTARELAHLAQVCIEGVARWARRDLIAAWGEPRSEAGKPAWLVVLGMGKLGGRELNFSSDVDLLFAYDEEGETAGGPDGKLDNDQFFHRQATRIVSDLEAQTPEGFLYRVDMRLRPEGRAGALAASIRAYEFYYETRGGAWERQALLRARWVAGDPDVGKRFLDTMRPFTYRKYIDEVTIQETLRGVHDLRKRMITRHPTPEDAARDVKNGPGGLRDVEFILQTVQVLYGGQYPEIRVTNSLKTLQRIYESGLLSTGDYNTLREAYLFLRLVEHRLQMFEELQTFMIPADPRHVERLGRSLGFPNAQEFRKAYNKHRQAVRRMYDGIFIDEELEDRTEMILDGHNPQGVEFLQGRGFADPEKARKLFQSLAVSEQAPHLGSKLRRLLAEFLPRLVERLAASRKPDMGLLNVVNIIKSSGVPSSLYQTLGESPPLVDLLVTLGSGSRFLSEIFAQDPSVLDVVVTPEFLQGDVTAETLEERLGAIAAANPKGTLADHLRRLRNIEILRTGLGFLLDLSGIRETTARNSVIAEFVLQKVLADQVAVYEERYGEPRRKDGRRCAMAVIGLGKLGGGELNFGSDLDLIFVNCGEGQTSGAEGSIGVAEFWNRVSMGVLNALQGRSRGSQLYEADARLRPFGRSAPMCPTIEACERYYREDAQTWERLALTRARLVAGHPDLGRRFEGMVSALLIRPPLSAEERQAIVEMRQRMESAKGEETLKAGPGGMVDVEFLVQTLMLEADPQNRRTNTWEALEVLKSSGHLEAGDAEQLARSFTFLRQVETLLRLVDNVSVDKLPREREALEPLVSQVHQRGWINRDDVDEFLADLEEHTRSIREIYNRYLNS